MRTVYRSAAAAGGLGVSSAFAALPEGVTSAITTAQADGLTAMAAMAVMGAAIFLIYKVLKKLGIL